MSAPPLPCPDDDVSAPNYPGLDPVPAPDRLGPALHVRLLWLPHAMPGSLFAALDVLRTASGIAQLQRPGRDCGLSWQVIGETGRALAMPVPGLARPRRRPRAHRSADKHGEAHSLLVIPGVMARNAPHLGELFEQQRPVLKLVERHAQAGGWIAASFNGIAYAAELGLLDGARIGAPWLYQSWMARRYPLCDFTHDEPMGVHGRVFHSVAPALQTEFMLRVLGHLHDPDLAQASARVLLLQAERQLLTPALTTQRWLTPTADSPVFRARRWLRDHIGAPYRLADVARAAAVSERTLLRHFRQVTGMTPLAYLHALRIERAKTLLEVSLHGTQAVAEACGYSDAATFRRLFQRATGMSMSDYRARYALRARRRYWRVEDGLREGSAA
ncbi:GlxA family transcriptional regulator [Cupriavidus gilardii]|uniref:GlxA family transcriptional regulator n=1 Tax=Cupriavidus gilardii TaxID=82541 RepID=UPI000A52A10A